MTQCQFIVGYSRFVSGLYCVNRCVLEANLKIEREWRCGVQKELEEEKQKIKDMTQKISMLKILEEVSLI